MVKKFVASSSAAGLVLASAFAAPVLAATVVVTPTNTQGWSSAGTTTGGSVEYVADADTAYGNAVLHLQNDATAAARSIYSHGADVALADVAELAYASKTIGGPAYAAPSFSLGVDVDNDGDIDTSLVHEPYWQNAGIPDPAPVAHNVWQEWDIDAGLFWSTQTVAPHLVAGAGGPPFYTLSQVRESYPDAVVRVFGVYVGTFNADYDVLVDGVNFNGTLYDFERTNQPASKDACKKGGYLQLTDANGQLFKNQGDCVSYVATGGRNAAR